jgi:hypothetical protein
LVPENAAKEAQSKDIVESSAPAELGGDDDEE